MNETSVTRLDAGTGLFYEDSRDHEVIVPHPNAHPFDGQIMRERPKSRPARLLRPLILLVLFCALFALGTFALSGTRWHSRVSPAERYFITGVKRADLFPTL